MRSTVSLVTLALAVGFAQASPGCTVQLSPTAPDATDPGEVISDAILDYLRDASGLSTVSSDCCSWTHATAAPYSVDFYPGIETGYLTDAELEPVLDKWVGTYIRSRTTTPESDDDVEGDYLVTSVACT